MNNHAKTSFTLGMLLLTMLLVLGCNVSTSKVTFGSGDYLTNSRGHGIGEVYGVKIEVIDAGGNELNTNQVIAEGISADGGAAKKVNTATEIKLGKVQLTVAKSSSGEITVIIDGKGYGQVEPGDSVVVDKMRNVTVNGEPRAPQEN